MTEITGGPDVVGGDGDLLAVPVLADLTWGPGADVVAEAFGDWIEEYLERKDFSGKVGQVVGFPGGDLPYGEVMLIGLGDEVDLETLRRAAGTLGSKAMPYPKIVTTLHAVEIDGAAEAVVTGFLLGAYRFDSYKSEPKESKNVELVLAGGAEDAGIESAQQLAAAVGLARDLVNEPAISTPPVVLARRAADAMPDSVTVEIIDESDAADRGFGGLLAVNAGADNPARLVILRYEPDSADKSLVFVGKGIVFDSGGLSIKPASFMEEMKTDMAGAAAVFGAMKAIAEKGLDVSIVGITPLTENMTGGSALRPGDVFTAYNGKTVEVLNTDAEGRLILADGLSLAAEMEPDLIVDIATLTGAAKVALGVNIAAVFGNDEDALDSVEAAAKYAGEKVWRMPLESEYRPTLDSPIADIKNIGDRYGGTIYAALFLKEFVGDNAWVHVDIAGPARASKAEHYITKGGTGFGVRTLVALAEQVSSAAVPISRTILA